MAYDLSSSVINLYQQLGHAIVIESYRVQVMVRVADERQFRLLVKGGFMRGPQSLGVAHPVPPQIERLLELDATKHALLQVGKMWYNRF